MVACGECGASDRFLYYCEHCGTQYCDDHLAPSAHYCDAAPVETNIAEQASTSGAEQGTDPVNGVRVETAQPQSGSTSTGISTWRPSSTVLLGLVMVIVLIAAVLGIGFLTGDFDMTWRPGLAESDAGASDPVPSAESVNETAVEHRLVDQLNDRRIERGLTPVGYDAELAAIAAYHSTDMAQRSYIDHVAPDGETVQDRFDGFGYDCADPSELVLFTEFGRDIETNNGTLRFKSETELADGILELWFRSEPHRVALLSDEWGAVGAGIVLTPEDEVYVTVVAC